MLTKEKQAKFNAIARELYTKEYLGVDDYGMDQEYEDELTVVASSYLMAVLIDEGSVEMEKKRLHETMKKKSPKTQSNIFKMIM